MKIKLKSPLDFLAEVSEINKESTAFRMAKEIEQQRIQDSLRAGAFFELMKSIDNNKQSYSEFFEQYYKENYED